MNAIYEYGLFTIVCACVLREAFAPLEPAAAIWQLHMKLTDNPLQEHHAWLEHLKVAREKDLLGPLRLEERNGAVCVVGMGECVTVESIEEGTQLIKAIKDEILGLFDNAPTPA